MTTAYELALLGEPSQEQIREVEREVSAVLSEFSLCLGSDVGWQVRPSLFQPSEKRAAAALFFGGPGVPIGAAASGTMRAIPMIPLVSSLGSVSTDLPSELRAFNCLSYPDTGPRRVATALLECAGLLPHQRRVFVSYRRDAARAAALQLFDALARHLYDVFLDTHGIAPGEDFEAVMWHRLCDSDVLIMLDTPSYFENRWTAAEFGRALAKGISVLQVSWPGFAPSKRTEVASRVALSTTELDPTSGMISDSAIDRICTQLEQVRSESIAVRRLNLVSSVSAGVERIGGKVLGIGIANAIHLELPDGTPVVAYTAVGVPTSQTLYQAALLSPNRDVAVVYDHIGLRGDWIKHLMWLGAHISTPRWVKAAEVAWDFANWGS